MAEKLAPLCRISRKLSRDLSALTFSAPVTHTYDPTVHARRLHEAYLSRFGVREGTPRAIFVGMNPGPWGMVQSGVPFGEVNFVRDWMGLSGPVDKPKNEHPKRPVSGLDCTRSEVSGARLWGWAKERFETADRFFDRFFVANYCPLVFMEESGRNFVPEKLKATEKTPLFEACDTALRKIVEELKPERVIGVGVWAKKRASIALSGLDLPIDHILHPSPASPIANRGWAPQAEAQLKALGVELD